MEIRALTSDDDLAAFGRLVHDSYVALPGHPDDADYDQELLDIGARLATNTIVAAWVDDSPAGCVTLVADHDDPFAEELRPGEGGFRMLAVDRSLQGGGVGGALIDDCLARLRALGHRRAVIHSGTWMTGAHRLYERRGFVRQPDRDLRFPEVENHLYCYRLDLTEESA